MVVKFKVVVDRALEHLTASCEAGVLYLSARDVEVSAALESFKDKLDVDFAL